MEKFIGLLILAGMFRSEGENTSSLWSKETRRGIFAETMPRKRFHAISSMSRFDNKLTRPAHQAHQLDKLAAFRSLWEMCESQLWLLLNPCVC